MTSHIRVASGKEEGSVTAGLLPTSSDNTLTQAAQNPTMAVPLVRKICLTFLHSLVSANTSLLSGWPSSIGVAMEGHLSDLLQEDLLQGAELIDSPSGHPFGSIVALILSSHFPRAAPSQ